MPDWLLAAVPHLKALHIAALCLWCGGLLALPMMLTRHDPASSQSDYTTIRHSTHLTYTVLVTPAGVVAVIAGTWLVFLRQTFEPWFFAKLAFVAGLVALHAWIGHNIVRIAEEPGRHKVPSAWIPAAGILFCAVAILLLVLGKPDLWAIAFPDWLLEPQGGQLPFRDVPRP